MLLIVVFNTHNTNLCLTPITLTWLFFQSLLYDRESNISKITYIWLCWLHLVLPSTFHSKLCCELEFAKLTVFSMWYNSSPDIRALQLKGHTSYQAIYQMYWDSKILLNWPPQELVISKITYIWLCWLHLVLPSTCHSMLCCELEFAKLIFKG
jgi:hypothetical protein